MSDIVVNDRIIVPDAAIETKAVRASGPGGQHVNKTASKIQMWIDLGRITGLTGEELFRVREFLKSRLDADGRLLVMSQETRDQSRNRDDCAAKAAGLLRAALVRPKFRRPTRPTRASKARRVEAKRHRSEQIRDRRIED
jgi:ribosome-associated protein